MNNNFAIKLDQILESQTVMELSGAAGNVQVNAPDQDKLKQGDIQKQADDAAKKGQQAAATAQAGKGVPTGQQPTQQQAVTGQPTQQPGQKPGQQPPLPGQKPMIGQQPQPGIAGQPGQANDVQASKLMSQVADMDKQIQQAQAKISGGAAKPADVSKLSNLLRAKENLQKQVTRSQGVAD